MKGKPEVLEILNDALRHELTAVNQYWLHYRMLQNWGFTKLAAHERAESIEEMQHADKLVDRILFLEGHPNMQKLDPLKIGENIKEVIECDLIAELCVPALEPFVPVDGCTPGTPCGFATIVSGFSSTGDAEDTEFGSFRLAADGTDFSVSPKTGDLSGGDIDSLLMTTIITPRPDGYNNMRSRGDEGDVISRLIARVAQDDEDEILLAADIWTHGTLASPQSGYFAWGNATSQAGLDTLNAGNVSVSYSGAMSVNNATIGAMTVNFGSAPNWTGTWTNPDYSFGAGGTLSGVNLISQPGQFTSNVTGTDSFVQGALVGEPGGAHGITHIIDVTLEGQGRIKDVGLLREVVTGPVIEP